MDCGALRINTSEPSGNLSWGGDVVISPFTFTLINKILKINLVYDCAAKDFHIKSEDYVKVAHRTTDLRNTNKVEEF